MNQFFFPKEVRFFIEKKCIITGFVKHRSLHIFIHKLVISVKKTILSDLASLMMNIGISNLLFNNKKIQIGSNQFREDENKIVYLYKINTKYSNTNRKSWPQVNKQTYLCHLIQFSSDLHPGDRITST